MTNHPVPRKIGLTTPQPEESEKLSGWIIAIPFLTIPIAPVGAYLMRTSWGRPYVIDALRVILVVSAAMVVTSLWMAYRTQRKRRPTSGSPSEN